MKKIGIVLMLAGMFLAVSTASSRMIHADQPLDCAPEDRVVAGNTNTDCKWDYRMDDITGVRFVVNELEGADACYGALEFYPYDVKDIHVKVTVFRMKYEKPDGETMTSEWSRGSNDQPFPFASGDNSLLIVGNLYSLDSPIPNEWRPMKHDYFFDYPYNLHEQRTVQLVTYESFFSVEHASSKFPVPPEINDFPVMLNACLAGVKLRLETRAQIEEDRAKLAAQEFAKQHALNEEKAKAALDVQRLAAAQKALQIQRETELTKTRSLIAQLERDKIILGVWNDIVVERLGGFQERAEITNKYMAEIETNAAAFSAKVREKYEELQRLEALNQAIADSIAAHNEEINAQLAAAAELEAKNMAKLEDLAVTPPTPAPTPGG